MGKKRKLDASIDDSALTPADPPQEERKGSMGGMWAGSAMNMLKQRIDDAHGSLMSGIMAGTVVLELEPSQVTDKVGSDRVTDWLADEDFVALVANIKRRGQSQPIRVRPANKNWTPDASNPLKTNDKFVIQSGRRRLAACQELNIPVKAVVSTDAGDLALADLEERFHENTMRRNLNGFEELISIGLLASSLKELTQVEISERLGVGQGDVSLGLACLENRKAILDQVDVANTPKRQFRTIIPKIKRGERLEPLLPPALTGHVPQRFDVRGVPMVAKKRDLGYAIDVKKASIADGDLEDMLIDIAKVVLKYQMKKP